MAFSFGALLVKELGQIVNTAVDGAGRHHAASQQAEEPKKRASSAEGCTPCAALAAQEAAKKQVLAFKKRNGFGA